MIKECLENYNYNVCNGFRKQHYTDNLISNNTPT